MSATPEKYSTALKIVKATLVKLGLNDKRYELQFLGFINGFLDEYGVEDQGQIKTVELPVYPNRTADLPDDYLNWVRVGQRVGDHIVNLDFNRDLSLAGEGSICFPDTAGAIASPYAPLPAPCAAFAFLGWVGAGSLVGCGPGGFGREFVVDKAERQIRLNSGLNPHLLYLEYFGSDQRCGPNTVIDPMAKMAAEYYLLWQYYLRKENQKMYEKYEALYYNEREKIVSRKDDFSVDTLVRILDDVYGHYPR